MLRQALLLVGTFVVTLAVLLGGYLALTGGGPSGVAAIVSPSPSSSAAPSRSPRTSPAPSTRPSAPSDAPSVAPSASWTPVPIMSAPVATPVPAGSSGAATVVIVPGAQFTAYDTQPHSTIAKLSSGSVVLTGTNDDSNPTTLLFELPKGSVPAGHQIARLDTVICGKGDGYFWEVYGPDGSDPQEYEAQPPASDGCWHFSRAPGTDTSVHADIQLASSLRIDKVVYTFWLN